MIRQRSGTACARSAHACHRQCLRWVFLAAFFVAQGLCSSLALAAELQRWTGGATPALDLIALDGQRYRLDRLRGKVVLVNFWATWCGPCRDELPSIVRLEKKLAGRPFLALAVNLDEPLSRVRKFLAQTSLTLAVLLDPGRKTASEWGARILPASFIVGPDGAIRYSVIGELDWADEKVVRRISGLLDSPQ